MKNSEVSKVFADIADLLELKGENKFKIRAYQKWCAHRAAAGGGGAAGQDRPVKDVPGGEASA